MPVSLGDSYFMAAIQYCSLFGVKRNIIVEDFKGLFWKTGKKHTRKFRKNPKTWQKTERKIQFVITKNMNCCSWSLLVFLHREEKVSSKRYRMVYFSYGILKKSTSPKGFETCARGRGSGLCEKGCRKPYWGRDTSRSFSCISASALAPGHCLSFLQLCPLLPTSFTDSESLLGLGTAPFPYLGPQSPVQLRLPPLGSKAGALVRDPCSDFSCDPCATCPGSSVARLFLPITKALLVWKGRHDSCIKKPHNLF